MAMKCPDCGAENPDYVFYCGHCSSALKEELRSKQKGVVGNGKPAPAVEYQPLIPRGQRIVAAAFIATGIFYLFAHTEMYAFHVIAAAANLAIGAYLLWASSSRMWRALHRRNMHVLERAPILAEAKVLNLRDLCPVVVLASALILVSLLAFRQEAIFGLLMAGVLVLTYGVFPKPIIGLEARGLSVRMKSQQNELFLPFSMISRMDSTNRLIKVVLKGTPFHLRYWYFVWLGNSKTFREGLEKAIPVTLTFPA